MACGLGFHSLPRATFRITIFFGNSTRSRASPRHRSPPLASRRLGTMNLSVFRRPACGACRHSVLRSFVAIAGVSIPRSQTPQQMQFKHAQHISRSYSQARDINGDSNRLNLPIQNKIEPGSLSNAESHRPSPSQLPWYLQVETPEPPTQNHPLAQRQTIPELPPNPPSILSPILHYLSVESGLDNLNLIDLRHLNPPPALGANLLMIIGTARSVKHLNVSADRFCRWLRTNYKLKPFADGLLGRNELKLKLRRKARRLKLAQSVGNTLEATRDDGITTGWICVNVGSVEIEEKTTRQYSELSKSKTPHVESTLAIQDANHAGYIGFGSRSTAPRIVVQMFTEEKRAEMDLEGLWDFRVARRAGKERHTNSVPIDSLGHETEEISEESSHLAGSQRETNFESNLTVRDDYWQSLVARSPDMYN